MQPYRPEKVVVEKGSEELPLTKRILERLSDLPVEILEDLDPVMKRLGNAGDPLSQGKKWLWISTYRGKFLKKCPGTQGFLCCNYSVLNAATGCPLECSYCILQGYLSNNPMLRIFANTDDLFAELKTAFSSSISRQFRVGTGELTDSLALDSITEFSRDLITFFGRQRNAILELKTKTDHVENLLDLPHNGKTVIAWSVNPEYVIQSEERACATLAERLTAAQRCQASGYKIAFHFDPILFTPGWERSYAEVVKEVFASVPAESIAWISLGGLRYPPELKEIIRRRFPRSLVITGEMVPCPDNKFRFLRPVRVEGYRKMVRWIREYGPEVPVYLCMESRDIWEAVFKSVPARIENLAGIF
jgi:spore photoproduct lyase